MRPARLDVQLALRPHARPGVQRAAQVVGEPVAIADHRDPLPGAGQASAGKVGRLPRRQHGLAAARAAADLDAVQQAGDVEQVRLLHGEPVGERGAVLGDGHQIARRQAAPGQDLLDQLNIAPGRRLRVAAIPRGGVPHPDADLTQLATPGDLPPRTIGSGEVVVQVSDLWK